MFAYNSAALDSYREFGVTEVEAIDGDEDDECATRDGQVYPVDEAYAIEDHPNGTLDWAPYFAAKSNIPAIEPLPASPPQPAAAPIDLPALVAAIVEATRPVSQPVPLKTYTLNRDLDTGRVIGYSEELADAY
jgi:hypothetical protein